MEGSSNNLRLSYVDFAPLCTSSAGFLQNGTYESFGVLITKANDWLRVNPNFAVINCESIEVKNFSMTQGTMINTQLSHYVERNIIYMIRCLRVFYRQKDPSEPTAPVQIGYYNVIPQCLSAGGFMSQPQFDNWANTISKFNEYLQRNPIPGFILNIETQEMKFDSWNSSIEPDRSDWTETNRTIGFVVVLRVFYQVGQPASEQIGTADFPPNCLSSGGFLSLSSYETFSSVMQRVGQWVSTQTNLRVTNVQSINIKIHHSWSTGAQIDSMRTFFYDSSRVSTRYIRVPRVCYVTTPIQSQFQPPTLSHSTFIPTLLSFSMVHGDYETLTSLATREIIPFANYNTGARILSVETLPIKLIGRSIDVENVSTLEHGGKKTAMQWVLCIRVYFDGPVYSPPAGVMQAPPIPVDQGCCNII